MQAVHSGADLESAITNCLGYKSEVTRFLRHLLPRIVFLIFRDLAMNLYSIIPQGQGFMVGVQINPVSGLPSGFSVMSCYFI